MLPVKLEYMFFLWGFFFIKDAILDKRNYSRRKLCDTCFKPFKAFKAFAMFIT